ATDTPDLSPLPVCPKIDDTFTRLSEWAKLRLITLQELWRAKQTPTTVPSALPDGAAHMPFLHAIWAAPLNSQPLIAYADWLESVGSSGAAKMYRQTADGVASERLRPDHNAPSRLNEYWTD
ncbi:MAG TPA: hypothetical protein VH120_17470, partial [Gemmataceae bacterium]|nr:hypothetical protein [Gemmataceae bacterium]